MSVYTWKGKKGVCFCRRLFLLPENIERRCHREPQQTRRLSDPRKLLLPAPRAESFQNGEAVVPADSGRIQKSACNTQAG